MTKSELAKQLQGTDYSEITKIQVPKGFVIVFGYSDDLIEVMGDIVEEFGAYGGGAIFFHDKLVFQVQSKLQDLDKTPNPFGSTNDTLSQLPKITTEGLTRDGWKFETNIPNSKFDILKDGEFFSEGLVIDINELNKI
jgi:hypothetical protein